MEKRIGSMVLVKHVEWRWEYRPLYRPFTPAQRAKVAEAYARIPEEDFAALRALAQEQEEGRLRNYLGSIPERVSALDATFNGCPLFDAGVVGL